MALEPRFRDPRRLPPEKFRRRGFNHPDIRPARLRGVHAAIKRRRREQREYKLNPLIPWSRTIEKAEAAYAAFDYVKAAWYVNNTWIGADLRGSTDRRRASVWSRTARIVCAFKAIGGKPAVTIRRRTGYSVAQTIISDLMGGEDSSSIFDVFLAWRCGCANNHEVIYKTLGDVPSSDGYHDACPHCGQAPLEILASPKTPKQLELICLTTP